MNTYATLSSAKDALSEIVEKTEKTHYLRQILYQQDTKQEFQVVDYMSNTDRVIFKQTKTSSLIQICEPKKLRKNKYNYDYKLKMRTDV